MMQAPLVGGPFDGQVAKRPDGRKDPPGMRRAMAKIKEKTASIYLWNRGFGHWEFVETVEFRTPQDIMDYMNKTYPRSKL